MKRITLLLLRKERFGRLVAFRSAKVAEIWRGFRGAKGDKGLSATETTLGLLFLAGILALSGC